jgi:hypothetical protein
LDDERRVTPSFSPSCPPLSYIASNNIFYRYSFFFLGRFNRIATDIGSLAPGMDEHVLRLGINVRNTSLYFLGAHTLPL